MLLHVGSLMVACLVATVPASKQFTQFTCQKDCSCDKGTTHDLSECFKVAGSGYKSMRITVCDPSNANSVNGSDGGQFTQTLYTDEGCSNIHSSKDAIAGACIKE